MFTEQATRKVIEVILDRGLKFGIDVAGGFLGPAWPVVRPLIEKLLDDMPKKIAGRYKSSREAVADAMAELEKHDAELSKIAEALNRSGLTPEWSEAVIGRLEKLSDDSSRTLMIQAQQTEKLDEILALAEALGRKQAARLVSRAERLEYVDYLRVPPSFQAGYDLAPGTVIDEPFTGRHVPAGFFIWNFMLLNDGDRLATVSAMELVVTGEHEYPEGAEPGGVLPLIESFEEDVLLLPGAKIYPMFRGKRFRYAPETDVDSFRIRAIFQSDRKLIQQLQLRIHWEDGTGEHVTLGTPLFLATLEHPQLEVSRAKFQYHGGGGG
jgi:hypothetical protein